MEQMKNFSEFKKCLWVVASNTLKGIKNELVALPGNAWSDVKSLCENIGDLVLKDNSTRKVILGINLPEFFRNPNVAIITKIFLRANALLAKKGCVLSLGIGACSLLIAPVSGVSLMIYGIGYLMISKYAIQLDKQINVK